MRNTAGRAASGTRGGEGRRRARVPSLLRAVAVALVAVLTASGCAREPLVQPLKGDLARRITIEGRPFEYCASAAIEDLPAEVTRVIIAVHGLDRGACGMRAAVVDALGGEPAGTLVVAPHFTTSSDAVKGGFAWGPMSWPAGLPDRSGVSSYAVMDALVAALGPRSITLVGFSGGGQFVNRYAAVSRTVLDRYVIINPSSYLWFGPERPGPIENCPGYNEWRYGLEGRVGDAGTGNAEEVRERYAGRSVRYLIGTADDDPRSSSLDRSCAAQAQGTNREDRARNYHAHLLSTFGAHLDQTQPLALVEGIGHDARGMLASDAGRAALRP